MSDDLDQMSTRNELAHRLRDTLTAMATPIDFPELERLSVLKRVSKRWYLLLKPRALPPYAWQQANGVGQMAIGDRLVPMVRFPGRTQKAAARLMQRLRRLPAGREANA